MASIAKVGETFYLRDRSNFRHLYVIISNPNDAGKIVVVNFTKQKPRKDQTLIVSPTQWNELTEVSVINYGDAELIERKKLQSEIANNLIDAGPQCPNDIVDEIIAGAFISPFIHRKILRELGPEPGV